MGYFSDSLDFEKFFAKDLLKGISKDPKRLILGVDPASTWAWNKVLGRDDKPLVDQMGGPYDGRVFSYGHGNGEVYDRAQAAGINTESAQKNHDAAHIIAASYALGGGFGNMGGGGEGAAQPGLWEQGFAGKTSFATGLPSSSSSVASGIPGIAGPVGGGTGASSAASMGAMDYAKLGMGLAGSAQPQQQHQVQPQQAPVRNMAQPTQVPTYGQRIGQGLGRVSSAMFPVDPSTGLTADQTRQLQTNALMQMGLGMLGSSSQGAGFGEAAAKGYGLAQGNLQGRLQQNYENSMANRAETRATDREKRLDEQDQWMRERQGQRDTIMDARQLADFDYRAAQDKATQEQRAAEQSALTNYRNQQLALEREALNRRGLAQPPSGYRYNAQGGLEFIPGGPADPKVGQRTVKPTEGNLVSANYLGRMEAAESLLGDYVPSFTDFAAANRLYGTEGAGILTTAAANKVMSDEGQQYYQAAADWVRAKLRKESGAVIAPTEMAQEIRTYFPVPGDSAATIQQKAQARAQAEEGMRSMAGVAVQPDAGKQAPPAIRRSVGGRNYVQIDGQWYEDDGVATGQ
jgi:hypothetical protein